MKKPETLNQQLAQLLGVRHVRQLSNMHQLQRLWPSICGQMMAARSEPVSIENGCLWIAVNHPSLTAHIRMLQTELLRACAKKAHLRGLKSIRTRIMLNAGIQHQVVEKKKAYPVTLSQKKQIVRELKTVRSHTLRHAMFRARVSQTAFQPQ